MLTGGIRTRAAMESLLGSGAVDVIGLGRPIALDPELPGRLLAGEDGSRLPTYRLPTVAGVAGESEWYETQLGRIGDGREVHRGLHPARAVGRSWRVRSRVVCPVSGAGCAWPPRPDARVRVARRRAGGAAGAPGVGGQRRAPMGVGGPGLPAPDPTRPDPTRPVGVTGWLSGTSCLGSDRERLADGSQSPSSVQRRADQRTVTSSLTLSAPNMKLTGLTPWSLCRTTASQVS